MFSTNQEIINTILFGTLLFLVLAFIIILSIIQFQVRQKRFKREKEIIKIEFNQILLQTQLEIQEQTFNYISQEIHDNVGQVLSLAKVQANIMCVNKLPDNELLASLKENLDKALSDLRNIAKSLSTERIRALGLFEAIAVEAERITKTGILQVNCTLLGEEYEITEQQKLILFRIVQEGLQNCIKHAGASSINITLDYQIIFLKVTIQDNGKGFDLQKSEAKRSGLGLQNMTSRASLIGGSCIIHSNIAEGTAITINLPYTT